MKAEWVVELSVNRARKLAGEGRIEEAYDILVGLTGHNNRKTFHNLRSSWRNELLTVLRRRFNDLAVYPQKTAAAAAVKKFALKSREVYVLELFDGITSLEDALAVSPVDEVDTLRSIAKLVDLGLLAFSHVNV